MSMPMSMPVPIPQQQQYGAIGQHINAFPPHPTGMTHQQQQQQLQQQQLQAGNRSILPPTPVIMPSYQQRMNISELVMVPADMAAFASDPKFQQILLKVKEQTMINFISLNRSASSDTVESVSIDAPSRESAQLARGLIETHFKLQAKLKASTDRLQKVQTDLFSAQGEIASGMMIEFTIDPDLVGLALGKKGARIKQIEAETKVHSINVTGDTGRFCWSMQYLLRVLCSYLLFIFLFLVYFFVYSFSHYPTLHAKNYVRTR
jgi:hypothetical protein